MPFISTSHYYTKSVYCTILGAHYSCLTPWASLLFQPRVLNIVTEPLQLCQRFLTDGGAYCQTCKHALLYLTSCLFPEKSLFVPLYIIIQTAPTSSTLGPRDLPIHIPEHTYDLEEPDGRERADVFAELRAWREQHSKY